MKILRKQKEAILMKGKIISLSVICSHSLLMVLFMVKSDNQYDEHQDFSLSTMISAILIEAWVGFFFSYLKLGKMLMKDWMAIEE